MKCLFIINPVAGNKTFQNRLHHFIGHLILNTSVNHIDTFYTKQKNDAFIHVQNLKEKQYDFLVCVGGDGTVNEVVGGLIESQSHIPLAMLPAGTVNDFATYLKLPKTPAQFIKMIQEFHMEDIDVGKLYNRYFINVVSGGMFSDIGFKVTREAKNILGPLSYYLTALSHLPRELSISLNLKVEADDISFEEEASLFLVTNSSHVGGFKQITKHANVQDGLLDLFIIKKGTVASLLHLLTDYNFQTHLENPQVHYLQAHSLKIDCSQHIIYDIDGEKGEGFPIEIKCLEKAVTMILPK